MIKPWDFVVQSRYTKKLKEDRERKTQQMREKAESGKTSSTSGIPETTGAQKSSSGWSGDWNKMKGQWNRGQNWNQGSWVKEGDSWKWCEENGIVKKGMKDADKNKARTEVEEEEVFDFQDVELVKSRPDRASILGRVQNYFNEDLAMHGQTQ